MSIRLNRTGLNLMLASVPKTQLAVLFGVSLPTLRRYANGEEPHSIAVIEHINDEIAKATKRKRRN